MSQVRVLLVTQEDPFYIAEFFRTFLADPRRATAPAKVLGAHVLDTLGEGSRLGLLRRMHALYGSLGVLRLATRYARKSAQALAHQWVGAGQPVGVQQCLRKAGIPVWRTANINAPETIADIASSRPDVIFSISATQKFSPDLLRIPRLGCFNSHSGALPRFRGMMPTFWTLYENEPVATVTIHKMAEQIDAGEIWRQESIPIGAADTLDSIILGTKRLSARMMWDLAEALAQGPVPLFSNESSKRSYFRFPTPKDSAELRKRGRRLL